MEPNFECLPYWSKAGCLSDVDMGILPTRLKGGMWIEFYVCMGIRLRKCLGMGKYMASDISETTDILP